jgi:hypothetical protein
MMHGFMALNNGKTCNVVRLQSEYDLKKMVIQNVRWLWRFMKEFLPLVPRVHRTDHFQDHFHSGWRLKRYDWRELWYVLVTTFDGVCGTSIAEELVYA